MHYPEQSFAQSLTENEEKVGGEGREKERQELTLGRRRMKRVRLKEGVGGRGSIKRKRERNECLCVTRVVPSSHYSIHTRAHAHTYIYVCVFKRVAAQEEKVKRKIGW